MSKVERPRRQQVMNFETELWREAGRPRSLDESLPQLAAVLAKELPLAELVVCRVDRDPFRLTTLASHPAKAESARGHRAELVGQQSRALLAWAQNGSVSNLADDPTLSAVLASVRRPGSTALIPLIVGRQLQGVALAVLTGATVFRRSRLRVVELALDPLTLAFEQDQCAHELSRMKEALVLDREALRLEREEISDVVIGETGGLRAVMERVQLVARTDAPVLILGETGSGKEVIARAIHARSSRSSGPVVRVNCGAIPPELVDSELFGHEKGAFTGAVGARQGWFERADGGTLFLDEVGELPLAAQVRLLRVLQDGSLERVGGQRTVRVDVRVIAATHRQLETMVADRTFREDLWYRLSVFPIRLPALRERMQDIPALASHFADHAGRRVGTSALAPTEADIALLESYHWPGNVRELAAVIERAAILGNGRRLEVATALGADTFPGPRQTLSENPNTDGAGQDIPIATLDGAIKSHIQRALAATHGRIEGRFGAARLLGVNPHTLRAKMRKLRIDWSRFRE